MSTDMVLPSEIKSQHESIQAHSELHIVQWNGGAIRCQSQMCQFHAFGECPLECPLSSGAVRYHSPDMHCQFCAHNECPLAQFRAGISSHQFHTHTECSLNHQYLLCHQCQAQWMSTESPVSAISPLSHTLNVHRITGLYLCLTSLKQNECSHNHQSLTSFMHNECRLG